MLVFDITNPDVRMDSSRQSFKNLEKWQAEFFTQGSTKDPERFPFVMLGNKCDRVDERRVETEVGLQWESRGKNISYYETSAKDSTNVDKAFLAIAKAALLNDSQELKYWI